MVKQLIIKGQDDGVNPPEQVVLKVTSKTNANAKKGIYQALLKTTKVSTIYKDDAGNETSLEDEQ